MADQLDEACLLVAAAGMAAVDFAPDSRATALRTLLGLIEGKLTTMSETLLPGGDRR